jgi:LacI family transcriptional regulator
VAKRVLVHVPDNGSFGDPILRGIAAWLRTHGGWSTTLVHRVSEVAGWSGDGVLTPAGSRGDVRRRVPEPVPVVELCGSDPADPHLVMHDHQAIGALAAQTLLERGHRHFATVGDARFGYCRDRIAGFQAVVSGLPCAVLPEPTAAAIAATSQAAGGSLAVLACTDRLGLETLAACRQAGLRVPEQVAVIGVDNDVTHCEFADPPLASIDAATDLMGWHGADLLDAIMAGRPTPPGARLVPPRGVAMRRSAEFTAVDDVLVAEALAVIQADACRGIEAGDLAVRLRCARRTLEARFRRQLGRSPLTVITERRLSRARQLLADTDDPLDEVARRCGWATAAHLITVFRRAEGMPPGAYRRLRRTPA